MAIIKSTVKTIEAPAKDMVHHPDHYVVNGYECSDIIEALDLNFNLGNVFKYVWRAGRKGNALEDLRKAQQYLEREIARRERT